MQHLSKSQFKPKALEIMRSVEQGKGSVVITDHGKPVLELRPYDDNEVDPKQCLAGSVVEYVDPLGPVSDNDWEAAGDSA